ncbi:MULTISPECIES: hypothetical protein [Pseudonocardia]|uniref:Uncharacterized protein n=2 Tax=Pseudonocardia TaxID=1847 RepID=A0A1Y2N021_PSEAH|nr:MULTISPECIES: hypothetical protein [Pseudonocardia]OSY40770.1 hypothetical protein BG845_02528 [Pseudonocardia autotrophica]TDN71923.1 hypothetical protein C8E95_0958 [Pseudonocardia autotrophica]BBG02610.1 hypothetical protein Pdca_38190 [Pseudonocardia autotrophica]GEC24669.1 hypothetical protein PSA01_16980 [Pseudonocardia saturnea]
MTNENAGPDTTGATDVTNSTGSTGSTGVPIAGARPLPRPLLWTLLVIALVANAGLSLSPLPAAVAAAFGVLVIGIGALLIRDHRRSSRATT